MSSGRHEVAVELITSANAALETLLDRSWSQSDVRLVLSNDAHILRLFVSADGGGFHRIAERSEGLRTFIALLMFTISQGATRPILLIDEAEQHLHWDAQADLIGMLHRQGEVAQVVYSTHSPGCLPQDLGAGIRLVLPTDPDRSTINNSPWTEGAGFDPLLLAMGATTAALTPSRRALIAEGATEFIVAPMIFRDAADLDYLNFQIVPGLAEANAEQLEQLDLQAARVAYLVDGDDAGNQLRKRLAKSGVDEDHIVQLPVDTTIEDYVSPEMLAGAVHEELRRSGVTDPAFEARDLPSEGRSNWVAEQLGSMNLQVPSKTRVAARIVEAGTPDMLESREPIADPAKREQLEQLLTQIHDALGL